MQEKESKTTWHFRISLIKSFLRIGAALLLTQEQFGWAGIAFLVAELFGIIEEV